MKIRKFLMILGISLFSTVANATPREEFETRVDELSLHVVEVSSNFQMQRQSVKSPDIHARLNEGIVLRASGDYERASYIFMDIVSRDRWKGEPAYYTAQYYLALSLYDRSYYRLAETHLVTLIDSHVQGNERNEAISLLIKTVQHTENWDVVIDVIQRHGNIASDPALQYALGRTFFLQGRDEEALSALQGIREAGQWQVKGDYIQGVLYIRSKDYETADQKFKQVLSSQEKFRGSDEVAILATLAVARLAYELQKWGEAVDYYQKVPESSPYFGDVLYEMGWANIRQENYSAAKQNFQLLMMSYPKHRRTLDTKHFLADLEREVGHYDEAMASYQQIVGTYEPIMTRMEADAKNTEQRRQYIESQIEKGEFDSIEIIPEEARESFAEDEKLKRVQQVLSGLEQSDVNTTDSEIIIREIESIISSPENIRALPEFRKFSNSLLDVEIEAIMLGIDLTRAYSKVDEDMEESIVQIAYLPRSQQERDILAMHQVDALNARSSKYHRLKLEAENTRYKIRVIRGWLNGTTGSKISLEEREKLNVTLDTLEFRLAALKEDQANIEGRVSALRLMGLEGASNADRSARLSQLNYVRSALLLQWMRDESDMSLDAYYRSMIPKLREIFDNISGLQGELDLAVSEKTEDFRVRLEREKVAVESEKTRYLSTRTEVGKTAGDIAANFWTYVYERVRDLVMDADLGMVDIAWIRKDERSRELSNTIEERKKERDVLEQDFQQYLKESGQ
ncbi:MAG: tetratricopeptide repeat protein [Proteobacteria bacterium]|nr:tetratricopeptide repeat protein [Pseudomonadota bacterium]